MSAWTIQSQEGIAIDVTYDKTQSTINTALLFHFGKNDRIP